MVDRASLAMICVNSITPLNLNNQDATTCPLPSRCPLSITPPQHDVTQRGEPKSANSSHFIGRALPAREHPHLAQSKL